jgi:hypothetical protein
MKEERKVKKARLASTIIKIILIVLFLFIIIYLTGLI